MDDEKIKKIIEAAKLYYLHDYNQNDIAKKLGVSRPTVSRFLQQAKTKGIVQITIMDPAENSADLARKLQHRYQLKDAIIVPVPFNDEELIKRRLGERAAAYLHEVVADGDIVGVTWGTTLYHIASELKPKAVRNVKVVQLKGGVSHSEKNTYASEILFLFGKAYNSVPIQLHLPAIVDHMAVKQAMEADRHIRRVLDTGKEANIAVFTVGSVEAESLLFQMGYFTEDEKRHLYEHAAGDICSRFYDKSGKVCNEGINQRTLGIELDCLKDKDQSILVAGGSARIAGIKGALSGGYANILITDQYTAQALLG
ncbi:deoxyribonucleoside regulator [Bacillus sp. OV322]|uniref:sugar-binding transcriptional regulator n=1 Tax=Bacillus sp. OV322 TaxID=1882764 RepID=UPI0008E0E1A6|nr:sugar-binding transcriptional regulator [Bacillus sp. OV322]SFC19145.1 deoxyribonucleoside regulator [Bacillus sp. OV322]